MNKLAAGALALALGLGAVAPAVAAETKSNYTGAELFLERYEKELKKVNALRDKALVAEAKIAEAEKRLDAAKARLESAKKAYMALYPSHVFVLKDEAKGKTSEELEVKDFYTPGELQRRGLQEATDELNRLYKDGKKWTADVDKQFAVKDATYESVLKDNLDYAAKLETFKAENKDVLEAAVRRYVNEGYDLYKSAKSESTRILAYQELVAAQGERDAAETNYRAVYDKYNQDRVDYNDALTKLTADARGYGYVVQIGNNGIKLVKDGEDKIKAPGKKATRAELIKELKAEVERNRAAVASAEFLLKYTPKTVAKVEGKLKAQIVDAKAAIEKAEKALAKVEKKAAFIATAYADDEEVSDEDLESLIKDNKESADNLENTMKENEKAQPEVEEKEEEKKPEEKKEEEKTPSKKAGNNARTGIAGVAGVAGILAAASVAYAASKRD